MDGNPDTSLRRIVVFECTAATPANGVRETSPAARQALSANGAVQTIRVPCSGKLQPEHFLKAFETGADLVVVLTCDDGECRYLEGHRRTQRRLDYVRGLLDEIGLGGRRLVLLERSPHPQTSGIGDTLAALQASVTASPLGRNGARG
jgi:coenzyme F420-reducing hydrogenase delta subunit